MAKIKIAPTLTRKYTWKPDLPDHRDHIYDPAAVDVQAASKKVDLRSLCSPVRDQGQEGICVGMSTAAHFEFNELKQDKSKFAVKSPAFIYYNARVIEGTTKSDAGSEIRDAIKTLASQGACSEKIFPYVVGKFATKPPVKAYTDGVAHKVTSYQRINRSLNLMRPCIAAGYPFVFGFSVYESFESDAVAASGVVPMPTKNEQLLGGHAVLAVGYDDALQRFYVKNSWGTSWGMAGYFTIPYDYLMDGNLSDDMWTIRSVQE